MSDFPARRAEPGTQISFCDSSGTSRLLKADSSGRVVIRDAEEAAQSSDLPLYEDKPATPAKGKTVDA